MDITYIDQNIKDAAKATIKLPNLYYSVIVSNEDKTEMFRMPIDDFFLRYKRELDECKVYYTINENLYYKPKALSYELYGTTELWLAILRANNMRNSTEFHYPIIKVYDPDRLKELIKVFFKREEKF